MNVAMLGAGAWGTALACHAAQRHAVTLWARDASLVAAMLRDRCNERYLPGVPLNDAVRPTTDLNDALTAADLIVVATTVAGLRPMAQRLAALTAEAPVLWLCKGLEAASGLLPHEVLADAWPQAHAGALSGPSFAQEVAAGLPVALTVASMHEAVAQAAVQAFHHGSARIYSTADVVGVEVGGALKNVMAVATGISDGLGLGMNARAALLTRGLAEISRYGAALGARPETFIGLAGLGDLVLTCTGDLSRNRTVGLRLARGESLSDILNALGHVAEGVACCRAVCDRARQLGVELPITQAVAAVLFEDRAPREAVAALMAREPRAEHHPEPRPESRTEPR
jgi:glycerol-3-phosphate dehydrogenase (NAD(P)+)